jgi:NAD(P)-dependent dehydrogenase (short-subunit alcohol dehydrogenase family)|tara:strand:+ start:3944 stop:4711 length:768 start_codon:yes stop_codon:yes gene_type:complete
MQLKDQVAVVTGASQGIGQTIAETFAREGAKVVVVARNEENLHNVASGIEGEGGTVTPCAASVSAEEDVRRVVDTAVDAYGKLDVLVNNAGIAGPVAAIEDTDLAGWQECIATNLTGAWLCCREVTRVMKPAQSGKIINIGSISGKRPLPQRTPYCASKMGLVGLTRSLAAELGAFNINVNCISPGAVKSPRLELLAEKASMSLEDLFARVSAGSALGRVGEPEDIAGLCVYLATAAAHNITGQDFTVDAGTYMD